MSRASGTAPAALGPPRLSPADAIRWARERLHVQRSAMQAGDWAAAQRIGSEIITELDRTLGRLPASP